ncbi:YihY/virulence factor BrkB family protein [Diaminobutyricimonas sp. TR449]|uniref:YihY/virulence factor BrkB family protein n=1 Tax=Diaminobutyricimonas sp. TR449 TaxID=2708076 RepID=UPI0014234C73|nr:YihY/virulence factor BrkB family protein [Diaminobutyricimonas sp. TR449]
MAETPGHPTGIAGLIARVQRWRPVRVFMLYSAHRGPILAAGLSYQALFAVFAGLWLAFAVAGLVIAGNPAVQDALIQLLAVSVPGLIDDGSGNGAIEVDLLLDAQILGWSGVIAAIGLLITALGWLGSGRSAVRQIFDASEPSTPFLLLKVKDLGLAIGFGVAVLVSATLSVGSTAALDWALGFVGLSDSVVATVLTRITGLALMFLLDASTLAVLYRVLSGLKIPIRRLIAGSVLAAAGLGALKVLGTVLLGGAGRNPLLASFVVIIGLLIWFNLVCQVILIGSAWIAVGMNDRGLIADPAVAAAHRARERDEQERIEREARNLVPRWLRWTVRSRDGRRSRHDGGSS